MTAHPSTKPTSVVLIRGVILTLAVLAAGYVVVSAIGALLPETVFGQSWTEPGRDFLKIFSQVKIALVP